MSKEPIKGVEATNVVLEFCEPSLGCSVLIDYFAQSFRVAHRIEHSAYSTIDRISSSGLYYLTYVFNAVRNFLQIYFIFMKSQSQFRL